jgi:hypothetical protein
MIMDPFRSFPVVAVVMATLTLAGCGGARPTAPKTYGAAGTVRYKNGSSLKDGMVQFQSRTGLTFTVMGEIHDGTFVLSTLLEGGKKKPGAIPDEYQVIVVPRGENQIVEVVKPTPEVVVVEAKEENRFEIVVEKVAPSR